MPKQIKDEVKKLESLLEEGASEKQLLEAVNEILESVKAVEADGLEKYTAEAIEYTEEMISKALGKTLQIEHVGSDVPKVSKASGALLSAGAEKEIRLVVTKLLEDQEPVISTEYGNGYALDISLYADGEKIQPWVPVTIRIEIPKSIDPKVQVKVLHYGEGSEEPEVLDARVIDGQIEFTTPGFSRFVIVNVMEKVAAGDIPADNPAISTGGQASGPANLAAATDNGSNNTVVVVVIVILVILLAVIGLYLVLRARRNRA